MQFARFCLIFSKHLDFSNDNGLPGLPRYTSNLAKKGEGGYSLVHPRLGEDELGVYPPVGGLARVLVGIVLELHYQLRASTRKHEEGNGKEKERQRNALICCTYEALHLRSTSDVESESTKYLIQNSRIPRPASDRCPGASHGPCLFACSTSLPAPFRAVSTW